VLVSVVARDVAALGLGQPTGGAAVFDPFEGALQRAGMCVTERREATLDDVQRLGSSWAKRLDIPRRRPAWLLTATMLRSGA
jgi:hypothetical protein